MSDPYEDAVALVREGLDRLRDADLVPAGEGLTDEVAAGLAAGSEDGDAHGVLDHAYGVRFGGI